MHSQTDMSLNLLHLQGLTQLNTTRVQLHYFTHSGGHINVIVCTVNGVLFYFCILLFANTDSVFLGGHLASEAEKASCPCDLSCNEYCDKNINIRI
jgi:hypothetical protein